jgi:tetratricopeptide (TPR) repeat protein
MATHKNLSKDPFEETGYLELAKTYLKMGRLQEALAECKILAQHYASLGMKDKAARVMAFMARIDSSKSGPQKEITGLKPPMKLKAPEAASNGPEEAGIREASVDEKGKEACFDLAAEVETVKSEGRREPQPPGSRENLRKTTPIGSTRSMGPDFNYSPGVERLEGGRIDDAIEQFPIAYEKKQNVFGSSHLGLCFKKKSPWEEAHPADAKASRADGISQDIIVAAKFELALILKEQGKVEEALDLFGEVFTGRSGISQYQRSNRQADIKINAGGKTPAQFCCFTEFDRKSQTQKGLGPGKNNQKKKNSRDRREYYCFYLLCSVLLWLLQNQFCLNT